MLLGCTDVRVRRILFLFKRRLFLRLLGSGVVQLQMRQWTLMLCKREWRDASGEPLFRGFRKRRPKCRQCTARGVISHAEYPVAPKPSVRTVPTLLVRYPERGSKNDAGAHPSLLRLVFHSLHSRDLFLLLQAKFVLHK